MKNNDVQNTEILLKLMLYAFQDIKKRIIITKEDKYRKTIYVNKNAFLSVVNTLSKNIKNILKINVNNKTPNEENKNLFKTDDDNNVVLLIIQLIQQLVETKAIDINKQHIFAFIIWLLSNVNKDFNNIIEQYFDDALNNYIPIFDAIDDRIARHKEMKQLRKNIFKRINKIYKEFRKQYWQEWNTLHKSQLQKTTKGRHVENINNTSLYMLFIYITIAVITSVMIIAVGYKLYTAKSCDKTWKTMAQQWQTCTNTGVVVVHFHYEHLSKEQLFNVTAPSNCILFATNQNIPITASNANEAELIQFRFTLGNMIKQYVDTTIDDIVETLQTTSAVPIEVTKNSPYYLFFVDHHLVGIADGSLNGALTKEILETFALKYKNNTNKIYLYTKQGWIPVPNSFTYDLEQLFYKVIPNYFNQKCPKILEINE